LQVAQLVKLVLSAIKRIPPPALFASNNHPLAVVGFYRSKMEKSFALESTVEVDPSSNTELISLLNHIHRATCRNFDITI